MTAPVAAIGSLDPVHVDAPLSGKAVGLLMEYLEDPTGMREIPAIFSEQESPWKKSTGGMLPFVERDVIHRYGVFILSPTPGEVTAYMKLRTENSLHFKPMWWSQSAFIKQFNTTLPVLGFFRNDDRHPYLSFFYFFTDRGCRLFGAGAIYHFYQTGPIRPEWIRVSIPYAACDLSANINDNYHDRSHGDGLWGWRVQSLPAYISGFRWYFTRHSWGRPLCGMSLGVLPVNFLSTYGFQIGNVLMVFSLSFVFTDRFTLMGEAMKTGVYIDDILREVSIAHLEEENDMHQA